MFTIADGREKLTQWDLDVKLLLDTSAESADTIDGARITSRFWREALFYPIVRTETEAYVMIPNILLQKSYDIIVYAYCGTDKCTKAVDTFEVEAKPKPSDYVYTETEILDYKTLEKRLKELETGGLAEAVEQYLVENPVEAGATEAEARQIAQNAEDIGTLRTDKLDASALPNAVNEALAQAKASGEFNGKDGEDGKDGGDGTPGADGVSATHSWNGTILIISSASGTSSADLKGEPGEPGQDGYTPVKGVDYFDGDNGSDYVLTDEDKVEIAEAAASLVDTALLTLIGSGEVTV